MDPQIYKHPQKFDPSRWENYIPKAGAFTPFGMGKLYCPGNELLKIETAILLHHFLLHYKMERVNPNCKLTHIPTSKPINNCLCKIARLP
ncbi:ent-kaurenoic acid oxidase 1-like [Benincasa hispida]|uniref:ent-kaurenoic acid oxidase 1-like n=1 Tax=Benincasa hispida TaxID=102211 RepID=UPI00190282B9|nr:ent-kaurenoic acid oxidase 1-like [Benincasa hispida]